MLVTVWRHVVVYVLLIGGAVALARGLYLQRELTRQLDTGMMGAVRSWVLWSTTDGRELERWYRTVTPWLIYGGSGLLLSGMVLALWPSRAQETEGDKPEKTKKSKRRAKKKA